MAVSERRVMRIERGTEHLQKGRLDRRVSEFTPVRSAVQAGAGSTHAAE